MGSIDVFPDLMEPIIVVEVRMEILRIEISERTIGVSEVMCELCSD